MTEGSTIGHYKVIRQLGRGGMGEVYLAEDTKLDCQVAIKVLPETLRNDPECLARFRREAKAVASLKHPDIATIHALEEATPVEEDTTTDDRQPVGAGPRARQPAMARLVARWAVADVCHARIHLANPYRGDGGGRTYE